MQEITVPQECPVVNPDVKNRILPDIALANQLTLSEESIDFVPELSVGLDSLAAMSGEYQKYKDSGDTQPIRRFIGCEACKLADVCPIPEAIKQGAEHTTRLVQLEGIIEAVEDGEPISTIWLQSATSKIKEENPDIVDDAVSYKLLEKLAEANIHSEETPNGTKVLVMHDRPTEGTKQKDVAILDTSGDITRTLNSNDKGPRIIKGEIISLFELIKNNGLTETLAKSLNTALPNQKTDDGQIIYKTRYIGTGGYRMFLSVHYDADRIWVLITGATDHDNQEAYLSDGNPAKINVKNYVENLKSKLQ